MKIKYLTYTMLAATMALSTPSCKKDIQPVAPEPVISPHMIVDVNKKDRLWDIVERAYNYTDHQLISKQTNRVADYPVNKKLQPDIQIDNVYIDKEGQVQEGQDGIKGDVIYPGQVALPKTPEMIDHEREAIKSEQELIKKKQEAEKPGFFKRIFGKHKKQNANVTSAYTSNAESENQAGIPILPMTGVLIAGVAAIGLANKKKGSALEATVGGATAAGGSPMYSPSDVQTIFNSNKYGHESLDALAKTYNLNQTQAKEMIKESMTYASAKFDYKAPLHELIAKDDKSFIMNTYLDKNINFEEKRKQIMEETSINFKSYSSMMRFIDKQAQEMGINERVRISKLDDSQRRDVLEQIKLYTS